MVLIELGFATVYSKKNLIFCFEYNSLRGRRKGAGALSELGWGFSFGKRTKLVSGVHFFGQGVSGVHFVDGVDW